MPIRVRVIRVRLMRVRVTRVRTRMMWVDLTPIAQQQQQYNGCI